ncbi:MAG: RNA pyrophosphohydrolase [Pseudomonas fluorescens]|nr:MAG: RNA pyrophosphohydrolase [Pseudomonas fluorescens]
MTENVTKPASRPPRRRGGNRGKRRGGAGRPAAEGQAAPQTVAADGTGGARAVNPARGRLRRNVGLVIVNDEGLVLAGLRSHANGDKAWQLPQGGIEGRERPLAAAYRELTEETGLLPEEVELLSERRSWIDYWLPREWVRGRRFAGQTQKWFAFRYTGEGVPDIARAIDREFEALEWKDSEWLHEHVIPFRKKVYAKIFAEFRRFLKVGEPK